MWVSSRGKRLAGSSKTYRLGLGYIRRFTLEETSRKGETLHDIRTVLVQASLFTLTSFWDLATTPSTRTHMVNLADKPENKSE